MLKPNYDKVSLTATEQRIKTELQISCSTIRLLLLSSIKFDERIPKSVKSRRKTDFTGKHR